MKSFLFGSGFKGLVLGSVVLLGLGFPNTVWFKGLVSC